MKLTMPALSRARICFFVFALIGLACMLIFYYSGIYNSLSLENIVRNKQVLQEAINGHYPLAIFICILLILFSVAFSLPITFVLTTAAGSFLGFFQAVLLSAVATVLGAVLTLLVVRYLLRAWLEKRYSKAIASFDKNFNKQGLFYLLSLLLLPITPFGVITVAAGLSNISVLAFSGIVALGVLPSTIMYAFAGTQLSQVNSPSDILSWRMVTALVILAVLALIPIVVQKYKALSHKRLI